MDNRKTGKSIVIETDTLDVSLAKQGSPIVNIIKMDIEGAESIAIDGMKETINRSPRLAMFTEFYPKGIKRFGREPLGYLKKLQGFGLTLFIIDEDVKKLTPLPPQNFEGFIKSFSSKAEPVKNIYAVKNLR